MSVSPKKQERRKKKDDKDKEKELLLKQQAKQEQERLEAEKRIKVLETSGILDAYEYFLRAICKNGLPQANIFEFAAQQMLKYKKKIKQKGSKDEMSNNRSLAYQNPSRLEKSPGKDIKPEREKARSVLDKKKSSDESTARKNN